MEKGSVHIFCGEGRGKSVAAIGKAIQEASEGKSVMIIQFLKKRYSEQMEFIARLEPEIKLFRFERSEKSYDSLSEQEREEEKRNIQNGMNFARKVLSTQGCDVLVLDEVLGLPQTGVIDIEGIRSLMEMKDEMSLILTGVSRSEELWEQADEVTLMQMMKP
ncbi:MAG: cob(I)yrinic acid a,c-diamide adenosyltransferase [Eubacteriales bacterium]|nr:cob(I)yrinic acid a,c-diamide adenosyltransferase [Eubacteriales bacterium]